MSKIIYIGTRAEYQPPKPIARHEVTRVALPYDDDHYLFPSLMRAYLLWNANKEVIKGLAWLSADMMADRYYDATTKILIKLDHKARMFRWYALPRIRKGLKECGKTALEGLKAIIRPIREAWNWRKELIQG